MDQPIEPLPLEESQPVIGGVPDANGESAEEVVSEETVEQPGPCLRRSTQIKNPPPKLKDYHPK